MTGYVPCTRQHRTKEPTEEPHDPFWDPDEFSQEIDLTVRTYDPAQSDLSQLTHLLVSESKATESLSKACWETPGEESLWV